MWALLSPASVRWQRLRTVLLSGLLTALLCLPGLPVALRQIPSYRNPNLVVPPWAPTWPNWRVSMASANTWTPCRAAVGLGPGRLAGDGWVLAAVMRGRGNAGTRRHGDTENHSDLSRSIEPSSPSSFVTLQRSFVIPSSPSPGPSCLSSSTTWSSATGQPFHALHQFCAAGLAAAGRAGAGWLGEVGALGRRAGCGRADRDPGAGAARRSVRSTLFSARTRAGW